MKIFFFLIVFLISVLYGCSGGNTEISKKLDEVYNLLEKDEPDSAHNVLMKLKDNTDEMSEAEKMRYDVYRVSSMNKMFVSLKDEEVSMQRAVEYYDKHGSPDEKMDACLLLGSVYRDMGDAPQALEWFDKAITHGEKGTNRTQLAKIHGQKADLFTQRNLLKNALKEINEMKTIAETIGNYELFINALSFKSSIFNEMGMIDSVLSLDKYLYNTYIEVLNDTVSAVVGMASSIPIFIKQGNFKEAYHFLQLYKNKSKRFESNEKVKVGFESVYSMYADFYFAQNQLDSAQIYYSNTANSSSWNNKTIGYYGLMSTFEKMGKSDSVVKYSILTCEAYNKLFEELQTNTLQQIEATYNYGRYKQESAEKALEAEKARNLTYLMISIFVISLCVICLAWTIWRHKKKREMGQMHIRLERAKTDAYRISVERNELKAQLEEKVAMIDNLRMRTENATESNASITTLQMLQSEVEQLNEDFAKTERNYAKMMNEGENILTTLLLKANSGINVNEKEWKRLEEYTKMVYPRFFDNLLSAVPNINQDYVRIAMLVKLEFSTTHIASLVCRSVTAISNARRRMYEKAHKDSAGNAELADKWIKGL